MASQRPAAASSRVVCSSSSTIPERANLKEGSPEGVYLSLTPGNPLQWSGVLFVRGGPYAPAVLRFVISFPSTYPDSPPLITFLTDIFHPLVTPLTTYTYTIGSLDSDTVSATDEERLPPGGFGLSNTFPHWFLSREQSKTLSANSSRNVSGSDNGDHASDGGSVLSQSPRIGPLSDHGQTRFSIFEVLEYMKRAFDDEAILDRLPAEAAANPGAWKAWQAHRLHAMNSSGLRQVSKDQSSVTRKQDMHGMLKQATHPDGWSWDGVWEQRAKKGIDASISNQALFGSSGEDDIVGFIHTEEDVC
ncbi:MAG: hypothetical protein Q9181_003335 [Wetmoreana brouardii]